MAAGDMCIYQTDDITYYQKKQEHQDKTLLKEEQFCLWKVCCYFILCVHFTKDCFFQLAQSGPDCPQWILFLMAP